MTEVERIKICPKCRTKNFATCHSMYCPMRKTEYNAVELKEDAERRQRHMVAKRILSDGDEEYKVNCICTLLESQQELASLREQLAKERGKSQRLNDDLANALDVIEKNRELVKNMNDVLVDLKSKEVEYTECSVESNINWEYFKGKKDAYEFAVKRIKRIFDWMNLSA